MTAAWLEESEGHYLVLNFQVRCEDSAPAIELAAAVQKQHEVVAAVPL